MNNTDKSISQLLDIILPPMPPAAIDYGSIFISLAIIAVIVAILIYQLRRIGFGYKIQIFILKNKLVSSQITSKQAAYKLARILQAAHKAQQLSKVNAGTTTSQQDQWQKFVAKLSDYRYRRHEAVLDDVLHLLSDAQSWTRKTHP